jgi:hypothetical protein
MLSPTLTLTQYKILLRTYPLGGGGELSCNLQRAILHNTLRNGLRIRIAQCESTIRADWPLCMVRYSYVHRNHNRAHYSSVMCCNEVKEYVLNSIQIARGEYH